MGSVVGIYLFVVGIFIASILFFMLTSRGDITFSFLIWLFTAIFLGKEFFVLSLTGFPDIYMERLFFIALSMVFFYQIWTGQERLMPNTAIEYYMIFILIVLLVSMSLTGFLAARKGEIQPFSAFLNGFFFPFFFYYFGKTIIYTEERIKILLWGFFFFLMYLVMTNFFEHYKITSLVFPRFIMDPNIGIHFGRARGPFGIAPVNGMFVGSLFFLTLFLRSKISSEGMRLWMLLLLLFSIPALFFTYTRAVWLSIILAPMVVFAFSRTMIFKARYMVFPMILLLLYVFLNWQNITSPQRATGGVLQIAEVEDRIALYETTKVIFRNYPIFGVGFGRFGRAARLYGGEVSLRAGLGAESQHNLYFAMVSEVGLIGLIPLILLFYYAIKYSWLLYSLLEEEGLICRDLVVAFWAIMIIFQVNAAFIQTQYFATINVFFFLWIGIMVGLYQRRVLEGPE